MARTENVRMPRFVCELPAANVRTSMSSNVNVPGGNFLLTFFSVIFFELPDIFVPCTLSVFPGEVPCCFIHTFVVFL